MDLFSRSAFFSSLCLTAWHAGVLALYQYPERALCSKLSLNHWTPTNGYYSYHLSRYLQYSTASAVIKIWSDNCSRLIRDSLLFFLRSQERIQPSCTQLVWVLKNESAIAEEKHHRQGKQSGKRQETLKGLGLRRQRENAQWSWRQGILGAAGGGEFETVSWNQY